VLGALDLRAAALFAPGLPGLVMQAGDADLFDPNADPDPHVLLMLAAHGWIFDELDPLDVLTPAAMRIIDAEWDRLPCYSIGEVALARTATDGPMLRHDPQRAESWLECVLRGSAGTRPPNAPVFVATGLADDIVPPSWQEPYLAALRAFGADLTHVVDPDADHCEIPFTARDAACDFLLARLGA
jgi:fermentation-respiration switch protein FrsA (DUF1100 family)